MHLYMNGLADSPATGLDNVSYSGSAIVPTGPVNGLTTMQIAVIVLAIAAAVYFLNRR